MNNKKSTNQQPNVNLNDLAKHLTPLPIHDRIYADCPHATAILIVVTYVDDNLVFTNCATLHQTFAAHFNKRVRFNDEGPAHWYLGTQYDRDPITGAVKASQELYINKLLARWHMSDCNPTKIPCSGKPDEVLTPLQQVPATPDPTLLRDYKEHIGSLLFLQTGTIPEISWIVSVLARYMTTAGEPHMAAAKKINLARKYPFNGARLTMPSHASSMATRTLPSPTSPTPACLLPATSSYLTEAPSRGDLPRPHYKSSPPPKRRSSALARPHKNASFSANSALKWDFTNIVPRSLRKLRSRRRLSKETRFRKRSKHIALRWYFIAERHSAQVGDLKVVHRRRTKMLADIFASPRAAPTFIAFRNHILGP
jgi:hypothetical protein